MMRSDFLSDSSLTEATLQILRNPLIQKRYRLNSTEISNIITNDDLKRFLDFRVEDIRDILIVDPNYPSLPTPRKDFDPFVHEQWKREWGALYQAKQDLLANFAKSVGCIKLNFNNQGASENIGTGWLIHSNVIATNWHVLRYFFMESNGNIVPKPTITREPAQISVNFSNLWRSESLEFRVEKILFLAKEADVLEKGKLIKDDLALLQIESLSTKGEPLPPPLPLDEESPSVQDKVCAVGYPSQENDVQWEKIKAFVVPINEDKWLGLGEILSKVDENGTFRHKCNTTRNSSGSPIISLKTDKVVGIHFRPQSDKNDEDGNLAVSIDRIRSILNSTISNS